MSVRPFKPQNMSNNAAVTADGGEIGRAQALQARAARVAPSVHMNPVLLKPQSEIGSQVVVQGRVIGNAKAREYQSMKPKLLAPCWTASRKLAPRRTWCSSRARAGLRDQPPRRRYRQYGICARRRCPGDPDRRHRPRRRDREPGRHAGSRRCSRRGAYRRASWSTSSAAIPRLFAPAMRDIAARTGWQASRHRAALSGGIATPGRGRAGARQEAIKRERWPDARRGAGLSAYFQF